MQACITVCTIFSQASNLTTCMSLTLSNLIKQLCKLFKQSRSMFKYLINYTLYTMYMYYIQGVTEIQVQN